MNLFLIYIGEDTESGHKYSSVCEDGRALEMVGVRSASRGSNKPLFSEFENDGASDLFLIALLCIRGFFSGKELRYQRIFPVDVTLENDII